MKAKPTKNPGEVVLELNRRDEALMAAADREGRPTPFRLKNILVPIDFSECSEKALRYGIPLAKEHGASITLLYVLPVNLFVGEYGAVDNAVSEAEVGSSAQQLAKLAAAEGDGTVPIETAVRLGDPEMQIIAAAKNLSADLIVISTHGRTGVKHLFLGSVAEQVVRRAPCPVLVVREREKDFVDVCAPSLCPPP